MPFTREQKEKIVEEIKSNLKKQKAMVFVALSGVKAKDLLDFRNALKAENCRCQVAKKTLLQRAFAEKDLKLIKDTRHSQVAVVFGFGDEISPARITYQFLLKNDKIKILGGFFENAFRSVEEMVALATIPARPELLAKLVGSIASPISGFAAVLQANIKGLLYVLKQVKS